MERLDAPPLTAPVPIPATLEPVEVIHRGSRTVVARCRRRRDGARVVVKTPAAAIPDGRELARYRHEHGLLRRGIEGVVRALELFEEGGRPYLVLEDGGGTSLALLLRERTCLAPREALRVAALAARALGRLHDAGIVHRDVTPGNLVWSPASGALTVIDLGIGSALGREVAAPRAPGELLGTLLYMPPEQTGRTHRGTDWRSDLYGLGATLWHALVGAPPFASTDPLELVHAHLARRPRPPHELRPEVPHALSAVVLKLLAKDPEDRYQSAAGLAADLERVGDLLEGRGGAAPFAPGALDRSLRFTIPDRLYGREPERRALLDAFGVARRGGSALVLVPGPPGIGKSTLVAELREPVVEGRGAFAAGRFEQLHRDVPYAAFAAALGQVLRGLLALEESELARRRAAIREALGGAGGLLARTVPELGRLLEGAEAPPELGPEEGRARSRVAFAALVRALADPRRPLALFLDDLQWADGASLELLEFLASDREMRGLLLVGGYREDEVPAGHPLAVALASLERAGVVPRRIAPRPLDREAATRLVADACRSTLDAAAPLAALLLERTGGNPFHLRALLERLHADGHIRLDGAGARIDLEAIRKVEVTANVVALLVEEIGRLPPESREAVRAAAALGRRFPVSLVAAVRGRPLEEVARALEPAVVKGLLVPEGDAFRLAAYSGEGGGAEAWVRFAHDRVEEAAYALVPEGERPDLHARAARLLLERTPRVEEAEALFDIVGHLRRGAPRLSPEERDRFAALALAAGRRAHASAAFDLAHSFHEAGLGALGADAWARRRELCRDLALGSARSALIVGPRDVMERRVDEVLAHASGLADEVPAWVVRVTARIAENRMQEAIDASDAFLARAGRPQPRRASPPAVLFSLARTMLAIGRRGPEQLLELPRAQDRVAIGVQEIQILVSTAQLAAAPEVLPLCILRDVRCVLEDGATALGAQCWTGYGLLLIAAFGKVELARRYGDLALAQVERLGRPDVWPRMAYVVYMLIRPWTTPMAELVAPLRAASARGLEVGDTSIAMLGAVTANLCAFLSGQNLDELWPELERAEQAIAHHGVAQARVTNTTFLEHVGQLRRGDGGPVARPWLEDRARTGTPLGELAAALATVHQALIFDDLAGALAAATRRYAMLDAPAKPAWHLAFWTYATVALVEAAGRGLVERRAVARLVREGKRSIAAWARAVPRRVYRTTWVEAAELAGAGRRSEALERYERAIDQAWAAGARHDAALICEQAARCAEASGRRRMADALLREAYAAYRQWGARAKVHALAEQHGARLGLSRRAVGTGSRSTSESGGGAATASASGRIAGLDSTGGGSADDVGDVSTDSTPAGALDLRSVLKASQALSEEIRTERLLERIMATLIENAGAVRGALVLSRGAAPFVEVEVSAGGDPEASMTAVAGAITVTRGAGKARPPAPLAEADDLPAGLVSYVLRTGEVVVLADAGKDAGPHGRDPYLLSRRPRSVLCAPVVRGGDVRGALYLENELAAGCFTADRLETIRLLASQAAISIENAALYHGLEERVRERTAELEVRNRFIRGIFGRYLSQEVVDGILEDHAGLRMGGELRRVTILMTDLRGFTALSARHGPEQVVRIINTYLSRMTDVVLSYGGTIDEFLGDAMLVIFGAPLLKEDDAERALACAVAMQLAMKEVNATLASLGLPSIEMGIGLTTGDVVVGNIGSEKRAKYGVVGPPVNLAARIESNTTGGQILAAESTCAGVPDLVVDDEITVAAKGVSGPVRVFQIGGIGGRHGLHLPREAEDLVPLAAAVEMRLAVQEGKHGTGAVKRARLTALGARDASLEGAALPARTDVRLWFDDAPLEEPIYAKVRRAGEGSVVVRFTSVPEGAKKRLEALRGSDEPATRS